MFEPIGIAAGLSVGCSDHEIPDGVPVEASLALEDAMMSTTDLS